MKWPLSLKIGAGTLSTILVAAAAAWGWSQWRKARLAATHAVVLYDTTSLRSGDLLFRNGLGNESLLVTTTSNGNYSHVGIACATPQGWHVVHAVPSEAPVGEPDLLKSEPIAVFYDPGRAMAGGTARVRCSDSIAMAATLAALDKVAQRVAFDDDYDTGDTTRLYCTELVQLAYMRQGIDLAQGKYFHATGFSTSGHIVFPEHLWQSSHLESKREFPVKIETN